MLIFFFRAVRENNLKVSLSPGKSGFREKLKDKEAVIGGQAHLYIGAGSPRPPLGDLIRMIWQLCSQKVCLSGGAINKVEQLN